MSEVSNTPSDLHGERDLAMGWLIRFSGSDDPDAYYAQHIVAYIHRLREIVNAERKREMYRREQHECRF